MAKKNKVAIEIDANADKGTAAVKRFGEETSKAFDTLKKKADQSNISLTHIKTRMLGLTAVSAGLAASVKLISGPLIEAASDLEETQGKFDVVFRGMNENAENWSKTLQKSYAMAEVEAKKYLSSIQDLVVPTGLAREEAGELSNAFVKLAADLGSFNNRKTEDVILDIQSALQGSSETMAKYGINVKAAKVQQEVLRMGLAASKKEITDAHKALAIYSIAMREGSDAVGDMARTSESYANQQKEFNAKILDLKTSIGQELLPVATEYVTKMNDWYDANKDLIGQKIPEYITRIKDSAESLYGFVSEKPEIMQFGIVGYLIYGKAGALIGAGIGKLVNDVEVLEKTLDAAAKGAISLDKVMSMSAGEREDWIKFYERSTKSYPIVYPDDAAKKDEKNLTTVKDNIDSVIESVKKGTEATGPGQGWIGKVIQDMVDASSASIAQNNKTTKLAEFLEESTSDAVREGITNGVNSAADMVGNIIGNTVGQAISRATSESVGSSIGGSVGTIAGSMVGGAAGGVVGSLVGGMFGGGEGWVSKIKKQIQAFHAEIERSKKAMEDLVDLQKDFREKYIDAEKSSFEQAMSNVSNDWNDLAGGLVDEVGKQLDKQKDFKIFGATFVDPLKKALLEIINDDNISSYEKLQAIIESNYSGVADLTDALEMFGEGVTATRKRFSDNFNSGVAEWKQGLTRKDWGVTEWQLRFNVLSSEIRSLNRVSDSFYSDSISLAEEQFDALKTIISLSEKQLSVLEDSQESLIDQIWEITSGSSADTSSSGAWFNKFDSLYASALAGNDAGAISDFQSFLPEFKDVMLAAGYSASDYTTLATDALNDILGNVNSTIDGLNDTINKAGQYAPSMQDGVVQTQNFNIKLELAGEAISNWMIEQFNSNGELITAVRKVAA